MLRFHHVRDPWENRIALSTCQLWVTLSSSSAGSSSFAGTREKTVEPCVLSYFPGCSLSTLTQHWYCNTEFSLRLVSAPHTSFVSRGYSVPSWSPAFSQGVQSLCRPRLSWRGCWDRSSWNTGVSPECQWHAGTHHACFVL